MNTESENKSDAIVTAILKELKGRSGFDGWWDGCDTGIRIEIVETLIAIVDKGLLE